MNRAARYTKGSVALDRRRGTWNYFFYQDGKRRSKLIGTKKQYPTKSVARRAAESFITPQRNPEAGPTVRAIVKGYMKERMPKRFSTRRGYRSYLRNHILPRWGGRHLISELQPRPVQLWLDSLTALEPKSRGHIKGLIRNLWEYAMYAGYFPVAENPMSLVHVKEVSKRRKRPIYLTIPQFHRFIAELQGQPLLYTMAIVCGCLGLRISEALALRWCCLDEARSRLSIERAIVRQVEDDVKTEYSAKTLPIDPALLVVLLTWKKQSQFTAPADFIFASAAKIGRLPVSYPWVYKSWREAAERTGITGFGCHTLRHSYRSWLDSVGTDLAVQKNLMRHADISMTLKYGDSVDERESDALAKITALTLGDLGKQHATARGHA